MINGMTYPYMGYSQPYQERLAQLQNQYQQAMPQTPAQNGQSLLWVQGEAGAKAYMMTPNTTVLLMDSEGQKFYLKSTDMSGVPSMRTFKYTEVTSTPVFEQDKQIKYVPREEFDDIKSKVNGILQMVDELKQKNINGGETNEQSDI